MNTESKEFVSQYGPWALIAGGARGIGEAYTRFAAAQGLNVAVIDSHEEALQALGESVRADYGVEYLPLSVDLSADDMLEQTIAAMGEREVGLLIYNAGLADVGPFFKRETGLEFEKVRIAVNVTGPMLLTYHFAKPMLARRAGGIVLMSSGSGLKGAPYYAHYSATKAYDIALGEALWHEFKPYDVNVLSVAAGMTLSTAAEGYGHLDTSTFQTTDELVEEAMQSLGQKPLLIAGEAHRAGYEMMKSLPDEQYIGALASHAIGNFLGGEAPEQVLDED